MFPFKQISNLYTSLFYKEVKCKNPYCNRTIVVSKNNTDTNTYCTIGCGFSHHNYESEKLEKEKEEKKNKKEKEFKQSIIDEIYNEEYENIKNELKNKFKNEMREEIKNNIRKKLESELSID